MSAFSHNPPDYLMGCLMSIEMAVVDTYRTYPRLRDKDVEDVYEQFREFYHKLAQDVEMEEPGAVSSARQALIEAVLEALDARTESGEDDPFVMNEDYKPGGHLLPCVEALYASAFNYLRRSVRFWRKEQGPTGYLKFLSQHLQG